MSRNVRFYVQGFLLTISESAYLVIVRPANGEAGRYQDLNQLPGWIFQSKHAIWMTEGKETFHERATRGERIKEQLLRTVILSNPRNTAIFSPRMRIAS